MKVRALLLNMLLSVSVALIVSPFDSQLTAEPATVRGGIVTGELKKWHPVIVSFLGPEANENHDNPPWFPNPFLEYRLQVTFTGPSSQVYVVPGYFDGDGNGNVWRVIFAPDEAGQWSYQASFRTGNEVAISLDPLAGVPTDFDGATGNFVVAELDATASGFLKWGRLEYVDGHYLKFRDGPYRIKGGTNSPENFLGYAGFDNTVDHGGLVENFLHQYDDHVNDWQPGDPNFVSVTTDRDGKGIIGALNYLSEQHINSIYFLPMNLGGDGQETYPFVDAPNNLFNKTHCDISKLHQWGIVFDHALRKGIALQIVLAETEFPNELWLDNGLLGVQRKLFYREMVARYGHLLAIKWNLSEENDYPVPRLREFADYIQALDPSGHPISIHTHLNQSDDYVAMLGDPRFSATSWQYDTNYSGQFVEVWRQASADAGRPWVLDMDENNFDANGNNANELRKRTLYDVYFSGGNIEWYAGYHPLPLGGDQRLEDFRTRETIWNHTWYARRPLENHLPFWQMEPHDELLTGEAQDYGGGEVFALPGVAYAIYLPRGNPSGSLDMTSASGRFYRRWYNPRTG